MSTSDMEDRRTRWNPELVFSNRRQHTRYWRDWSSDVCSSDLHVEPPEARRVGDRRHERFGVAFGGGEALVFGVPQGLEKVLGARVRRLGALLEELLLRLHELVLGERVEDDAYDEARHRGDAHERDKDPGPKARRGQQAPSLALARYVALPLSGPGGPVTHARHGLYDLRDRKSTRLNSSHANISYDVFCLKKKEE